MPQDMKNRILQAESSIAATNRSIRESFFPDNLHYMIHKERQCSHEIDR